MATLLNGRSPGVRAAAFPTGRLLLLTGTDSTVRVLDRTTGDLVVAVSGELGADPLALGMLGGDLLVARSDGQLQVSLGARVLYRGGEGGGAPFPHKAARSGWRGRSSAARGAKLARLPSHLRLALIPACTRSLCQGIGGGGAKRPPRADQPCAVRIRGAGVRPRPIACPRGAPCSSCRHGGVLFVPWAKELP